MQCVRPRGRQPDLGVAEGLPRLPEDVLARDEAVGEADPRVAAGRDAVDRVDRLLDHEALRPRVDEEHRRPALRAGHDDGEGRAHATRDEPLLPVDDPAAVGRAGLRAEHGRIGAGARGALGHGKARAHLAAGERGEPALALHGVGDALEHRHVALVGRRAVHGQRSEQGAAGLLEDDGLAADVEAQAAQVRRDVRREQPRLACGRLQPAAQLLTRAVAGRAVLRLEGDHHLLDERAGAGLQVGELGCEVQGHDGETNGR
jgi:hypothetical protein